MKNILSDGIFYNCVYAFVVLLLWLSSFSDNIGGNAQMLTLFRLFILKNTKTSKSQLVE